MKRMRAASFVWTASMLALPAIAGGEKTYTGQVTETQMAFTVTIDEYTSDDDTFALAEALLAKGQQGLIGAVSQLEAGQIQFAKGASYQVNVVRTLPSEQGLIVAFVTDRPLNSDKSRKASSPDPALGYLELLLNDDGTGSGRLIPGARVIFNEDGYMQAESSGGQIFTISGVAPK